jgi:hypothetical protein
VPFKKGQSGNPAGRAKGSRHKATIVCEQLFDRSGKKLSQVAIERAEAGDPQCLKLALDRILPVRRDRPVKFRYEKMTSSSDAPREIASILEQMAAGELTAAEGSAIIAGIEAYARSQVFDGHEERLRVLEEKLAGQESDE